MHLNTPPAPLPFPLFSLSTSMHAWLTTSIIHYSSNEAEADQACCERHLILHLAFLIAYLRVLKLGILIGKLKYDVHAHSGCCPITTNEALVNQIWICLGAEKVSGQFQPPVTLEAPVCGAFFCNYTPCPVISLPALLLHLLPKTNSNKAKVTMDTWGPGLFFLPCQCYWKIPLLNLSGGRLLFLSGFSRLWMMCAKETMPHGHSWKKERSPQGDAREVMIVKLWFLSLDFFVYFNRMTSSGNSEAATPIRGTYWASQGS